MTKFYDAILLATGSTEPSNFNEFLSGLADNCPTERSQWAELFRGIEFLEKEGFIEVDRVGGKVSSLQLTQEGVAYIRDKADAERPLLNL